MKFCVTLYVYHAFKSKPNENNNLYYCLFLKIIFDPLVGVTLFSYDEF